MREDQRPDRRQPDDEAEDRFDEALDDLFGADELGQQPAADTTEGEPAAEPGGVEIPELIDVLEQRAHQLDEGHVRGPGNEHPPPSYGTDDEREDVALGPGSGPPPSSNSVGQRRQPEARGRSWRRIACLGCATFAAIVMACLAALLVIGLIVDDEPSEPTVIGQFVDAESSTNTGMLPSPTPALTSLPLLERTIMGERPPVTKVVDGEAGFGTLDKPVPVGTETALGDGWLLRVNAFDPDAEQAVLDANAFNEPAETGRRYVVVEVTAWNETGLESFFSATFRLRLLGLETKTVYMTFEDESFCGVVPDPVEELPILPGASVTGNVCWIIDERDTNSLVLFSEEFDASEHAIWFNVSSGE